MLANAITRGYRSLRKYGPVHFVKKRLWVLEDVLWERRYGVRTREMVGKDQTVLSGPNAEHASSPVVGGRAVTYATPRIGHLRHALRAVPADGPRHLVDYGSGMGRVLLAARLEGYQLATGVELSEAFCAAADDNLAKLRRRHPELASGIETVHEDAMTYAIEPEQNVFYFYNPFGPPVLRPVLDAIEQSVRDHPRLAWVLYLNHVHRETFDEHPALRFERDLSSQMYDSSLYVVRPPD